MPPRTPARLCAIIASISILSGHASATPQKIGLDFGNFTTTASTDIAGVPAVAQAHWNPTTGNNVSGLFGLNDQDGNAIFSPLTTTGYSASGGVQNLAIGTSTPNQKLMVGFLEAGSGTTTITLTSLPFTGYDLYVYTDGNNGSATRTGSYTANGVTLTATDLANTDFSGTYIQGQNYLYFPSLTGNLTLTAVGFSASDSQLAAPINAIQVVAPEPTTLSLLLSGVITVLLKRPKAAHAEARVTEGAA